MEYAELRTQFKDLNQKASWSISLISRVYEISKPTTSRILKGHKVRDLNILRKLGITKKWRHLDDLTPAQVKYIFDNRETMP